MFKRLSRKAQISYEVSDQLAERITRLCSGRHSREELDHMIASAKDVLQIQLNVVTPSATFSSICFEHEAPIAWEAELKCWLTEYREWMVCHRRWLANHALQWVYLQQREGELAEIDNRLQQLRLAPCTVGQCPIASASVVSTVPSRYTDERRWEANKTVRQESFDSVEVGSALSRLCRAILATAYRAHRARLDSAVVIIRKCLDEVDHYRKCVGITPAPVGFHDRARKEIDACYQTITSHVKEEHCAIQLFEPQRPPFPSRERLERDFISTFILGPTILMREGKDSDREYALYQGSVWECEQYLGTDQWRILADAYIQRESAELNRALGQELPRSGREVIPTLVRRAVWQRDAGRCTQCGSRERLEFDHIVPVAKGGGNTERNIELLCEACNRTKSDSIV